MFDKLASTPKRQSAPNWTGKIYKPVRRQNQKSRFDFARALTASVFNDARHVHRG
jgi:hypothetical protein